MSEEEQEETQETAPETEEEVTSDELPEQFEVPGPPEESRFTRFVQRAFRWTVGLSIVFALGVLAAVLAVYLPTARSLGQVRGELEQARAEIAELNARLEEIGVLEAEIATLESEKEALQEALHEAELHVYLLSALADVISARLALAQEDPARAKVHLTNTPRTLETLAERVGAEQSDMLVSMQQRLALAIEGIENDSFAAQSDLDVLANNLVQLENTYFAGP